MARLARDQSVQDALGQLSSDMACRASRISCPYSVIPSSYSKEIVVFTADLHSNTIQADLRVQSGCFNTDECRSNRGWQPGQVYAFLVVGTSGSRAQPFEFLKRSDVRHVELRERLEQELGFVDFRVILHRARHSLDEQATFSARGRS